MRTAPSHGETAAQRSREASGERARESPSERSHESPAQLAREHGSERIFGINPDSTVLVAIAAAVSLVLVIAPWLTAGVLAPLLIVAFAVGAAAFDVREIFHQLDESRTNLAVIASVIAFLHLLAATSAVILIRRQGAAPIVAKGTLSRGLP